MGMTELMMALALTLNAEKSVCVPNATGDGWDCGKGETAPAPRPLPATVPSREATRPPLYLMNPDQMPQLVRESIERGDYATAEAASERLPPPPPIRAGEPAVVDGSAATAPEVPSADPVMSASSDTADPPDNLGMEEPAAAPSEAEAAGERHKESAALADEAHPPTNDTSGDQPAAVSVTQTDPGDATPAVGSAGAAPQAEEPGVRPDPDRPTRSISSTALGADDLLALPADHYTVQLTAARSLRGFTELRQTLQLAVEDTFVVQVKRNGEDWWLMLWRSFPDVDSARNAAATISTQALWPRRLGPVQTEVRAAKGQGSGPA